MPRLLCDGRSLELTSDQSVLDALSGAGFEVSSSCRVGACQSCLVQAIGGAPPARAQVGVKDSLRAQGFFLACQATLTEDLEISLAGASALEVPANIVGVNLLAPDVLRVVLETQEAFAYRAGQFVTLLREDGLARAYSLASLPSEKHLELHVRVLPRGAMSNWLSSPAAIGSQVRLRGPAGDCCYVPGNVEQPLVLAGVGTGLAPLWGVLRDALAAKHQGRIELWHGARTPEGLYLTNELQALAATHRNFTYYPCALEPGQADSDVRLGSLDQLLLAAVPSFAEHRVYLCGDAGLVQSLKRRVFLAGASLPRIHADAFVGSR
ncbi:MAG: FAD-binding oxidoreductase [Myxococcales bacterium]